MTLRLGRAWNRHSLLYSLLFLLDFQYIYTFIVRAPEACDFLPECRKAPLRLLSSLDSIKRAAHALFSSTRPQTRFLHLSLARAESLNVVNVRHIAGHPRQPAIP